MCGIYGFIGKPNKTTEKIVKNLGLLNIERGVDSTGIAIINYRFNTLIKEASDSKVFFNGKTWENNRGIIGKTNFLILLGHTRAATRGEVNQKNAHPFKVGRIVLTHNGGISNFDELMKKYNIKYEVDSQIIPYLLNRESVTEVHKELSGYWTAPFVNLTDNNKLHIMVHSNKFSIAIEKKNKSRAYYSSQLDHLVKGLGKEKKQYYIYTSGEDKLYTYIYKDGMISTKKIILPAKPYTWNTGYTGYNWSNWNNWSTGDYEDGELVEENRQRSIWDNSFHRVTQDDFLKRIGSHTGTEDPDNKIIRVH